MKDELILKIQKVLDEGITEEMRVVYLLVELRKLMDRVNYKDPVLRMFCNWVVHTELAKRGEGSELVLTEFDGQMAQLLEHHGASPHFEHLSFDKFRDALTRCFGSFGLSASFVRNNVEYVEFVRLYSLIVGECPIVFSASKTPLKYVKQIELQGFCDDVRVNDLPVLQWQVTLNNGETMKWGFHME